MLHPTINDDAEPEQLEEIIISKDNKVKEALRIYQHLNFKELQKKQYFEITAAYSTLRLPTLHPSQIDLTLQHMMRETPKERINCAATGIYITHLIQKSYYRKNNTFILNVKDTAINALAYELRGTRKQPINITLNGNIGNRYGWDSEHCNNDIRGSVGVFYCFQSKYCNNTVRDNTGMWYCIRGEDCTHKTTNPKTYKKMVTYNKTNISLINEQGTILEQT